MKRIFIITLALMINGFIFSEECFLISYNEYDFYLIENNLYISAYNGSDRDIILPDNVLGYPVIGIAPTAFSENIELQSVIIPDSIKIIGDFAFEYCRKLGDVKMSDSIEVIGNYAFSNCHSLKLISLPKKLTHIGDRAFQNCGQLTIESMPASVKNIGSYAFWNCRETTQLIFSSNIEEIGEYAFAYNFNLKEVFFKSNENIENPKLYIEKGAFLQCSNLTHIILPNTVVYISDTAFSQGDNVILQVEENSYAHDYAIENNFKYEIK